MEKYLELLMPVAQELGLEIVNVDFVNNDVLEVSIGRLDYLPITIEAVSEAAERFGEAIDWAISLDVGSAGAERVIDPENYSTLESQYVLVKFKNPLLDADYVEGIVKAINEDVVVVAYRQKTALKSIDIPLDNVRFIRLAVKL